MEKSQYIVVAKRRVALCFVCMRDQFSPGLHTFKRNQTTNPVLTNTREESTNIFQDYDRKWKKERQMNFKRETVEDYMIVIKHCNHNAHFACFLDYTQWYYNQNPKTSEKRVRVPCFTKVHENILHDKHCEQVIEKENELLLINYREFMQTELMGAQEHPDRDFRNNCRALLNNMDKLQSIMPHKIDQFKILVKSCEEDFNCVLQKLKSVIEMGQYDQQKIAIDGDIVNKERRRGKPTTAAALREAMQAPSIPLHVDLTTENEGNIIIFICIDA